ncbi:virulence RhuM family protein [Idiomarina sp. 28-8]|uniref:virulence RhuM family protein n=1 Tax=Idiomarina sp. 28-8 TaxID=1260624 RepID=UPI000303AFEB|nr:RhuM family protein [Idiomarina sp. 28-8]
MNDKQIQIFESQDGQAQLEVALDKETVWLSQEQMAELFGRERSVVAKHIRNIFKDDELDRNSVCANFAHTASDGKTYQVGYFNLDVIISVGYRVKSQRGVQFRQWATRVLKEHLVEGYTLNQRRLQERGIEFEQALNLLSRTLSNQGLVSEAGEAVAEVISEYARSWSLLQGYDEQVLAEIGTRQNGMQALDPDNATDAIQ